MPARSGNLGITSYFSTCGLSFQIRHPSRGQTAGMAGQKNSGAYARRTDVVFHRPP
jgi:hypothetical protein